VPTTSITFCSRPNALTRVLAAGQGCAACRHDGPRMLFLAPRQTTSMSRRCCAYSIEWPSMRLRKRSQRHQRAINAGAAPGGGCRGQARGCLGSGIVIPVTDISSALYHGVAYPRHRLLATSSLLLIWWRPGLAFCQELARDRADRRPATRTDGRSQRAGTPRPPRCPAADRGRCRTADTAQAEGSLYTVVNASKGKFKACVVPTPTHRRRSTRYKFLAWK
jgi:hypothetical protein